MPDAGRPKYDLFEEKEVNDISLAVRHPQNELKNHDRYYFRSINFLHVLHKLIYRIYDELDENKERAWLK